LAEEVRKYHLPDFSNWQPPAAFVRAFARLENDLRTGFGIGLNNGWKIKSINTCPRNGLESVIL
jgi:hypothetical protein